MSARPRGAPPPREGRLALITAIVLTIAVPGVGHIWMNMIVRGLIWLGGNLAIVVILMQGDAATGALLAILGAVRLLALVDLLIALRVARTRGEP